MRTPRRNGVLRRTPIEGARVISLKLAAEDMARLKTLAFQKDTSVSELIRVAVAALLERADDARWPGAPAEAERADDDQAPPAPTKPKL